METDSLLILSGYAASIAGILYMAAMAIYIFYLIFGKRYAGIAATAAGLTGFAAQAAAFITRWYLFYKYAGNGDILRAVPITNLYESLLFFALVLSGVYLYFEYKTKNRTLGVFAFAVSGTTVLFIEAIGASSSINLLVPALQSNWLLAHVSLSFTAYVCFAVSAISAAIYLILTADKGGLPYFIWTISIGCAAAALITVIIKAVFSDLSSVKIIFIVLSAIFSAAAVLYGDRLKNLFRDKIKEPDTLDAVSYKFIAAGFAIFTIGGIVFGAIWAEQAWGRYWSWDPKETWAFITWCVYGIYLHGRLYGKWNKRIAGSIALIGFIITVFTYLGVNLLLSGLHSYGSL